LIVSPRSPLSDIAAVPIRDLDPAEVALFPFAAYKRADVFAFASR
jgi:hypothetical protein